MAVSGPEADQIERTEPGSRGSVRPSITRPGLGSTPRTTRSVGRWSDAQQRERLAEVVGLGRLHGETRAVDGAAVADEEIVGAGRQVVRQLHRDVALEGLAAVATQLEPQRQLVSRPHAALRWMGGDQVDRERLRALGHVDRESVDRHLFALVVEDERHHRQHVDGGVDGGARAGEVALEPQRIVAGEAQVGLHRQILIAALVASDVHRLEQPDAGERRRRERDLGELEMELAVGLDGGGLAIPVGRGCPSAAGAVLAAVAMRMSTGIVRAFRPTLPRMPAQAILGEGAHHWTDVGQLERARAARHHRDHFGGRHRQVDRSEAEVGVTEREDVLAATLGHGPGHRELEVAADQDAGHRAARHQLGGQVGARARGCDRSERALEHAARRVAEARRRSTAARTRRR